jgi:hypothetical protein
MKEEAAMENETGRVLTNGKTEAESDIHRQLAQWMFRAKTLGLVNAKLTESITALKDIAVSG